MYMLQNYKFTKAKVIYLLSFLYVVLPILLFFIGWTRKTVLIIAVFVFALFVYRFVVGGISESEDVILRTPKYYWIISIIALGFWVYLSGIGNFCYQNTDFWVRNPVYNDLCGLNWPIYYELSSEPEFVKNLIGYDRVFFSYYFAWWLVPAAISKLFGAQAIISNLILYFYALTGALLAFYLLCRITNKCSYKNLLIFIFFSGLDVIVYFILNQKIPFDQHIEWSSTFFQFPSNTTLLFWVFNQCIPVWIITELMMLSVDEGLTLAIGSLTFAYSPWAAIGIIPVAVYRALTGEKSIGYKIKRTFSFSNIFVPLLMLVSFGTFYSTNGNNQVSFMPLFYASDTSVQKWLMNYVLFMTTEVLCYVFAMGNIDATESEKTNNISGYVASGKVTCWPYYKIVIAMFFIASTVYVVDGNFNFRGIMPVQLIFMVIIIKFLDLESYDNKELKYRKAILTILLVIGAITPLTEINRSIVNTATMEDPTMNETRSFTNIETESEFYIEIVNKQFFVHDYSDTLFYKYIGK